jgi:hypothetical protein
MDIIPQYVKRELEEYEKQGLNHLMLYQIQESLMSRYREHLNGMKERSIKKAKRKWRKR